MQAGLVGLPNVGKSTLFNALTKSSIPAENYPFCTIDPHVAITEVPDTRLDALQKIYGSAKKIPSTVKFVDIAGLVKGAAEGEGLGNKFLSHIREVDLILHVLRCFEDSNITHTSPTISPVDDYETIVAELMLKDLESVEKRLAKFAQQEKMLQGKAAELKELYAEKELLLNIQQALEDADEQKVRTICTQTSVVTIPLLSSKNFLIIANVAEDELEDDGYKNNKHYQALLKRFGAERVIPICAKIEYELSQLADDEIQEMMDMFGLKQKSLESIIQKTFSNLGLITFFTCGPKEAHAWPIIKGKTVREAGGEIHSDLERGFICAEIFNCNDLFKYKTEARLKELGKIRREGQDYLVQDGDLVLIRFNV
ncbi:redox-regulated ATPase YchF [bacterium]|nr:redox-regulated ATPase YchF [bacterium]